MTSRLHDALVVGAGPAGAALAHALAEAGRDVVLVEREAGPHDKVCGEFLSHEAVLYLRRLGLDPQQLGAVPIEEVALSAGPGLTSQRLPFPAWSLSRRCLDEVLIGRAGAAGADVRRGQGVRHLEQADGAWHARLAGGSCLRARHAFLATGKHDLHGWKRGPGRQDDLIGMKLHCRLTSEQSAALRHREELFLFPGGYAGLAPIEGGLANLCLLVRRRAFQRLGRNWQSLLSSMKTVCPHLAARLEDAHDPTERPLAIAGIPYGLVQAAGDGCWRLGDQAVVIPSFAGEGMSIALHSARLAADFHLEGRTPQAFQRRLSRDASLRVQAATWLSRLLVQDRYQAILARAAQLLPGILSFAASATRLPDTVLRVPNTMAAGRTVS